MAKKRSRRRKTQGQPHSELSGLIIIALALLAAASLLFPQRTGVIGPFLESLQRNIAGDYALFFPFSLLLWGVRSLLFPNSPHFGRKVLSSLVIMLCLLASVHIYAAPALDNPQLMLDMVKQGTGGGILGALTAIGLLRAFGLIGTLVVFVSTFIIAFLTLINLSLKQFATYLAQLLRAGLNALIAAIIRLSNRLKTFFVGSKPGQPEPSKVGIHDYQTTAEDRQGQNDQQVHQLPLDPIPAAPVQSATTAQLSQPEQSSEANAEEISPVEHDYADDYQLPPLNLLQKTIRLKDPQSRRDLESQAGILERTLASFGVEAKVINVHRGPTITRFEIQPASGVKVNKIVGLSDDLALSLAATSVRIEAPIPGKSAVGLEVANRSKATVYFREVLESDCFGASNSKLAVVLGKDIGGEPVVADLMDIPHLLIAGATGAGKSVYLNTLIASLLFKAKPNELKLLLIDPKVVELNIYNGLPHLLCPVITDPRQASQALKNIIKEMESRYQAFAAHGTRDINRYNELAANRKEQGLPYIIVIVDELADLMMTAPTEIEDIICRIAQKSRAAGIHLVVATQRPSVDVITGVIKANITTRIAFSVSSQADSRTILDMGGAEKLLGRGDMLYLPVGLAKPVRIQSAYISEEEVEKIVAHILAQSVPVVKQDDFLNQETVEPDLSLEKDELIPEAARMIVESGQASISLLQRRLRIGYTRAARLIDDLEQLGIVGGFEGSKARKILVSLPQLESILEELG